MIRCPKCNSDNVNAYLLVSGFAWGNLKTGVVDETPDYCDFDTSDGDSADKYICDDCLHNWGNK